MSRRSRSLIVLLCVGIVTAALSIPAQLGYAHKANPHYHKGWTKHTVLEQFDVTATEVYIRQRYLQTQYAVYPGVYEDRKSVV